MNQRTGAIKVSLHPQSHDQQPLVNLPQKPQAQTPVVPNYVVTFDWFMNPKPKAQGTMKTWLQA